MGFKKIFEFITTNNVKSDNQKLPMSQNGLNNESYRKALEQFLDRRRSYEGITDSEFTTYESINQNSEYTKKDDDQNRRNDLKLWKRISFIPGVPHIPASEIFEIGNVAGTEDRYLELTTAEWHNTRVSLRRHTHPVCDGAIKADIEILTQIRHSNVLLLMATTQTDEHGLVSIFEPIECTLYNYVHEQGQRISIREIARLGMTFADTLKYCHMRGYVHGALSSHCIYFTPDGTIKIGGWEMAIAENNKVEHDYEECLRTEIFRWQAPEFFHGLALTTKSDVYGLSLLLWEIGTAHIPWHGCNRPHVERQYANQRGGIIMNLRAFPPRLGKILESGLQLDMTKRTMDMDKIRRALHRILMLEEEGTYIKETKNNNDSRTIYPFSTTNISSTSLSKDITLIKKPFVKQSGCHINEERLSNQFSKSKITQCNGDFDVKKDIDIEKEDVVNSTTAKHTPNKETTNRDMHSKQSNVIKEHRPDEGSHSAARSNIKRLKEMIANRRENFFHENEPSSPSCQTPNWKGAITLSHTNSNPDYVLCKPASHATNMELKYRKSHSEYEGTTKMQKPSCIQKCKSHTPYTNMSPSIRDAIIPRKTLHSDLQSFYESTLWRKEKLICLSRMGRSKTDGQIQLQKPITPTNCINNEETRYIKPDSTNDTYTIKNIAKVVERKLTENNESLKDEENSRTSMKTSASPDQSVQNLKDALDRAANIVRSTTPYEKDSSPFAKNNCNFEVGTDNMQKHDHITFQDVLDFYRRKRYISDREIKDVERSTSCNKSAANIVRSTTPYEKDSSPFPKNNCNFEVGTDNMQKHDHITFEDVLDFYRRERYISDREIKDVERSTSCDKSFLKMDEYKNTENNIEVPTEHEKIFDCDSSLYYSMYNTRRIKDSESTEEKSSESQILTHDQWLKNLHTPDHGEGAYTIRNTSTPQKTKATEDFELNEKEFTDMDTISLQSSNIARCKNCQFEFSHDSRDLSRRFSLPSKLNQPKIGHSPGFRIYARKGGDRDSTVEDLYIDDEFGSHLNNHLILFNDDLQLLDDYTYNSENLLETTEL